MAGKRGGARPGAGRPKKNRDASLNVASILEQAEQPVSEAEIAKLARSYLPSAIRRLAHISQHGKSESAAVRASEALVDRSFGRGRMLRLTAPNEHSQDPPPPLPSIKPADHQSKLSGFADLLSSIPKGPNRTLGPLPASIGRIAFAQTVRSSRTCRFSTMNAPRSPLPQKAN